MTRTEFSVIVARARALAAQRRRARIMVLSDAKGEERAATAPAWLADLLAEERDERGPL